MLETSSERLSQKGGPHFGSPDKVPAVRLRTIEDAGRLAIPFTTGILVGIGETLRERAESLVAIRSLHLKYRHVQEIIVQNFRAKAGTAMHRAPEPREDEFLATVAVARVLFGAGMNLQAPPNLSDPNYPRLIDAGINDWGGVSPVTIDHVEPRGAVAEARGPVAAHGRARLHAPRAARDLPRVRAAPRPVAGREDAGTGAPAGRRRRPGRRGARARADRVAGPRGRRGSRARSR